MSKTPALSLWQQGYQPMRRVNRGEYSILKPSPEGVKPTCYIVDLIRMTCTCAGYNGHRKPCKHITQIHLLVCHGYAPGLSPADVTWFFDPTIAIADYKPFSVYAGHPGQDVGQWVDFGKGN